MLELVLAGWVAAGGLLDGGKLPDGWAAFSRARENPTAARQEIDWIKYYKGQGSHINAYPPNTPCYGVWVSPQMQWAVPNNCLNGPPWPATGYPTNYPGGQ